MRRNEGRSAAHERRGEHPAGGLRVRARHKITEIINGEEITVLNPLIHGYIGGIIPSEIAAARHVDMGDLELRGALGRKPELFLRLGGPAARSRIWLAPILEIESRATTGVVSRRANAGRHANFGGYEFWRARFSARIFTRTN